MAYAQEMKNLVVEIKTGHRDRTNRIGSIKKETRDILRDADDYMGRVARELKEMAATLKDSLGKGEAARIANFKTMMKDIIADVGVIRRSVNDLLADYEGERKEAARSWAGLKVKRTAPAGALVASKNAPEGKDGQE